MSKQLTVGSGSRVLVLEVRYAGGETQRYFPVAHPQVPMQIQADRLRKFLLEAISRGGAFSVEVVREDDGSPSRRIFLVDQISAMDVFLDEPRPAEAARTTPPDPRRSFFFLERIAEANPAYQV